MIRILIIGLDNDNTNRYRESKTLSYNEVVVKKVVEGNDKVR